MAASRHALALTSAAVVLIGLAGCASDGDLTREHLQTRQMLIMDGNDDTVTILEALRDRTDGNTVQIETTIAELNKRTQEQKDALSDQRRELERQITERNQAIKDTIIGIAGSIPAAMSGNVGGAIGSVIETVSEQIARDRKVEIKESEERTEAKIETEVEQLDARLRSLDTELADKIDGIRADTEAIADLETRIEDLPDEAAVQAEVEGFLRDKGLTDQEIDKLFQEFSVAEILALLGVGGGAVVGSRTLSQSGKKIDALKERIDLASPPQQNS